MEKLKYHRPRPLILLLGIGEKRYYAHFQKGAACDAFIAALSSSSPTRVMADLGGYGKSASIPFKQSLPGTMIHIIPGDLVALPGGQILLCYQEQDIQATPLAHIASFDLHEFSTLLGDGDVEIHLCLEWSE